MDLIYNETCECLKSKTQKISSMIFLDKSVSHAEEME